MKTTMSKPFRTENDEQVTLKIELDPTQCYKDDPGQGTPAMVIMHDASKREVDSGTFYCAAEAGELSHNGTQLNGTMLNWLEMKREIVDKFIAKHSV
jgi:hypothetical protein